MRYKGAVISATPPTTSTTTATGVWTLPQQMQAQGAGNWPYGGPFTYIEDVFSTWLYTGTGANQTITNNINLSANGGLVWIKDRSQATDNVLYDTARGVNYELRSDTTQASLNNANSLTAFNSNGFSIGVPASNQLNISPDNFVSWTFRKQSKFFDIVTYTGNGANGRAISHNLGSVPGCIIAKSLDAIGDWFVYHQNVGSDPSNSAGYTLYLNTSNSRGSLNNLTWNGTAPTSTTFTANTTYGPNNNGTSYVAYLFASNAGGFGLTGNDNVITCGSFVTNGSGTATVALGYEPQWLMVKRTDLADSWYIVDNMRGWVASPGTNTQFLSANSTGADGAWGNIFGPNSTGFNFTLDASATYIYIAIRRGPMKVPTVGTSVFNPNAVTSGTVTTNFPVDLQIAAYRSTYTYNSTANDRLRGVSTNATTTAGLGLITSSTNAEGGASVSSLNWSSVGTAVPGELSGASSIYWNFQRAPGFFDEVCYTGTGTSLTVNHNLGVVPELIIGKRRSGTGNWAVYAASQGLNSAYLNRGDIGFSFNNDWLATPTSTQFSMPGGSDLNTAGQTQVAYLFATCSGVSKVGSYSGTGATQTIDCGFTGGARFVLIKRANDTGAWYVWDTARGMVSGTDPSLLLNSTAAEVNANSVYTTGVGFQIVSTAAGINASGGTYIFWAVA